MRPAHRSARLTLALLLASAAGAGPAMGDEMTFPTPPRQGEPWAPPRTTLPRFLASATAALCEQGLADPRGCDYRTVRIVVGDSQELATAGWVLPAPRGVTPRHAIAWNGLVYPIIGGDAPADLDGDIRRLEQLAEVFRQAGGRGLPLRLHGSRGGVIDTEWTSVRLDLYQPIKVCLLLRSGRVDLAEKLWAAGGGLTGPVPAVGPGKLDLRSYGISYLTLARELAGYRYERAVSAHLRGDDPLALLDARALTALAGSIEARCEAMGFDRPDRPARTGSPAPYLDFLGFLPELRADQERRAKERANPAPPARGEGRDARIAGLIRHLDQVHAVPWVMPGRASLGSSVALQDLIAEGDAAVEPLLWALRSDDRLTRTGDSFRSDTRGRAVQPVAEAAYDALRGILKADGSALPAFDHSKQGREGRGAMADQVEAYWRKNREVPLVERWYRTLLDDKAGGPAWLEAAGNITAVDNPRPNPGAGRPGAAPSPIPGLNKPKPLKGESLRKGHEPTVSALLARRVESMLKAPEGYGAGLKAACQMGSKLAEWDPIAAMPTLRELTRLCRGRYSSVSKGRDRTDQDFAGPIAGFTIARLDVGDVGAAREYAEWVRTFDPAWSGYSLLAVLEPIARRPDDPDLAAAAAWLFGAPESPWNPPVGRPGTKFNYSLAMLIPTALVKLPAFRAMLLKGLEDRSPFGTAEARQDGMVDVQADGASMGRSAPTDDRDPPPQGVKVPIRICDFYAWQLATLEAAPPFHPCWPEPRRDAALAAIADYLRTRGAQPVFPAHRGRPTPAPGPRSATITPGSSRPRPLRGSPGSWPSRPGSGRRRSRGTTCPRAGDCPPRRHGGRRGLRGRSAPRPG